MPEAIVTHYAGQRFRSRLEATWAVFFDLLRWPWLYEPFDLAGYIPDFVLRFSEPLLVEVKPELTLEALQKHTGKIQASGWKGEALILGAGLMDCDWQDSVACGLLAEHADATWWWAAGILGQRQGLEPCLRHSEGGYNCRLGHAAHDYHDCWKQADGCRDDFVRLWRKAQNETQWRAWTLGAA